MFLQGYPGRLLGTVLVCLTALKVIGAVVPAPQRFIQEISHQTTNVASPQLMAIVGGKPKVFAGGAWLEREGAR